MKKQCSKCHEDKPLEDFKKSRRTNGGRYSQCKKCVNAYEAKRRKSQKHVVVSEKKCSGCGGIKSKNDFHNHSGNRDGLATKCKECVSEQHRDWYGKNTDRKRKSASTWASLNIGKKRHNDRLWQIKNPKKVSEYSKSRALTRRNATPKWLTKKHIEQVEYLYWLASDLTKICGEPYEVDHIIPLRGKNVCGLHVPWNLQILPRDLNRKKGSSYEP